jgi:hypothetical protein
MAHRWAVNCVDQLFQDIMHNTLPFGGKLVVFSGDFRQLTPVHRFCSDPTIFSICTCNWYPSSLKITLLTNVRAADDVPFSRFVAEIGEGRATIQFPEHCYCLSLQAMIERVWQYGTKFFSEDLLGILVATRADVVRVNEAVLEVFPGRPDYQFSVDSATDCESGIYDVSFVNTVSVSGCPDHKLCLKKGARYICMRNLSKILCNGTLMTFIRRVGRALEFKIDTGTRRGERGAYVCDLRWISMHHNN